MERAVTCAAIVLLAGAVISSCSEQGRIPLIVQVSNLSLSKLPFVIAEDQGLYAKYGLKVELQTGPPPFDGGRQGQPDFWTRVWRKLGLASAPPPEVFVNGASPSVIRFATGASPLDLVSIAATDCVVRSHIVGRPGINSLEELKGMRVGVSNLDSTEGFIGRLLAERMGWDPDRDVSIVPHTQAVTHLRDGLVDAAVAYEMDYAILKQEGFPILADTAIWNEHIGGNSVLVERTWLQDSTNREAARRFLMASAEGLALLHQEPELALHILEDWYGIEDRGIAETAYARSTWMPREPYPCYEGIERTMELYDSTEMRQFEPHDFYDDRLVIQLIETGFVEQLYR